MDQQSQFLSLEAVADLLKVGVPTVQSLIDRGLLQSQVHDRQVRVPYQAVLLFLRDDQRKLIDDSSQASGEGMLPSDEPAR